MIELINEYSGFIQLIINIIGIVFVLFLICYIKSNNMVWNEAKCLMESLVKVSKILSTRIDELEAQQKKDREDIAGFVNELIKKTIENE